MTQSLPERLGPYRIVRLLGRGGMGVVYEALDERVDRAVALKVLDEAHAGDDKSLKRLEREARAAARVTHPNVVMLLDVIAEERTRALVHELVKGGSLMDCIKTGGRIPWREAALLGSKIALGLGAIHAAGLIHRDVKPANVLIDPNGEPRIADFGLAKLGPDRSSLSKTGQLVGTLEYLAPELAGGTEHEVGPGTDLYALGATLHEMLTGAPPFRGSGITLITQHLKAMPPSVRRDVPEVPEEFALLVLRLLAKAPQARGESAAEVARELAKIGGQKKPVATTNPVRSAALGVALAIGVVGVLGAAGFALHARPKALTRVTLTIDSPKEGDPVAGDRVRVSGSATGTTEIDVAGEKATPGSDGRFSLEVPLRGDEVVIAASGPAGGSISRIRVKPAVPAWFIALDPRERPRLPLRNGLKIGAAPKEYLNELDGSVLVHVPAGKFKMGGNVSPRAIFGDLATLPGFHVAFSPAPTEEIDLPGYFIGKFEVSVLKYRAYATATQLPKRVHETNGVSLDGENWTSTNLGVTWELPGGLDDPDSKAKDEEPVVCVTQAEARAYCEWAHLALPTEAQWEKAALWAPKAIAARVWPWGDEIPSPSKPRANFRDGSLRARFKSANRGWPHEDGHALRAPVGAMEGDESAYSARDMAGNVQEFVADDLGAAPDAAIVIRGGSFFDDPAFTPTAMRNSAHRNAVRFDRGFRVAITER